MGKIESLRQAENHIPESIRFYLNQQNWCYTPHWHMSYEMLMVIENRYDVTVDGTKVTLMPGDLLIIPSGTVHEIIAPETGERFYFMIDRDRLLAMEGMRDIEYCFYPYMLVRAGDKRQITARFLRAAEEYRSGDILGHSAAHMELSLMLIGLAREQAAAKSPSPSGGKSVKRDRTRMLFVDVCSYIANHCTESLCSEELAGMAGYSTSYFERMFSEYVGVSFHDFLTGQRLNHSKRGLIRSDDPVTVIAHDAGFNSIATVNRIFREREGMSPTAYRKLREYAPYDPDTGEIPHG